MNPEIEVEKATDGPTSLMHRVTKIGGGVIAGALLGYGLSKGSEVVVPNIDGRLLGLFEGTVSMTLAALGGFTTSEIES
jgi:hypothetical protein